jgi:hypothetical protein
VYCGALATFICLAFAGRQAGRQADFSSQHEPGALGCGVCVAGPGQCLYNIDRFVICQWREQPVLHTGQQQPCAYALLWVRFSGLQDRGSCRGVCRE